VVFLLLIKLVMLYNVSMDNLTKDFVCKESRDFNFKLGTQLASSLSGFVAGVVVSSIVWYVIVFFV